MTRSRRAKWAAFLSVAAVAIGQAAIGGTFGAFASETAANGNVITASPDWRGPNVSPIAIGKNSGNGTGAILPSAAYRVYANVNDVGTPASGTSTVTANVSSVTAGQTAVPLVAGTYTAGGVSYNYRSGILNAGALPNGNYAFSVTATDAAGNVTNASGSVAIDSSQPAPTNISASGGVAGRAEVGDVVTFTTNDTLDTFTILAGWNGSATTVQARLVNAAGADRLEIRNAAGTTVLPFGTIGLGRTDFVGGGGASFPASTMTQSNNVITVVLGGTVSGAPGTAAGTGTMSWTPSNTVTDRAGNAMSPAAFNEPSPLDIDF